MSKFLKFIGIMFLIFAASILLAPVIAKLLPMFKFEKIFNRLIMIFAVAAAALFVLYRRSGEGSGFGREFWRKNGFDFSVSWKKLAIYGFLSGALAVAFIAGWETVFGPRYLRSPFEIQDIVERFFKGLLSGVVVGIIEEFFFRGFIFGSLKQRLPVFLAVIFSSAFYSLVHFFDNGQVFIPENPTLKDAVRLLIGYAEPFTHRLSEIFPEFFGLFVFGIILSLIFLRSGSLFLSIGVHAGTVFMIKFQHSFIRKPIEDLPYAFYGKSPDYDGSFEWLMLAMLGLILWFFSSPRLGQNSPPSGPTARKGRGR